MVKGIWCLTLVMGASIVMECILAKDSRRRATVCIPPEIYETLCLHAYVIYCDFTVKFLNFGTPEIFAVMYLKFKQRGQYLKVFRQKHANGIVNSEDPDQTAPLGAV